MVTGWIRAEGACGRRSLERGQKRPACRGENGGDGTIWGSLEVAGGQLDHGAYEGMVPCGVPKGVGEYLVLALVRSPGRALAIDSNYDRFTHGAFHN